MTEEEQEAAAFGRGADEEFIEEDLPRICANVVQPDGTELTISSCSAMEVGTFLNNHADAGCDVTLVVTYIGADRVSEILSDLVDEELEVSDT